MTSAKAKLTLPVILAYRRGNDDERAFWQRTVAEGEVNDADLDHAMELMARHKTIEATLERARYFGSVACDAMATFPDSTPKTALLDVVSFCVDRAS